MNHTTEKFKSNEMATFVNLYKVIYTRRWINYITFYIDSNCWHSKHRENIWQVSLNIVNIQMIWKC